MESFHHHQHCSQQEQPSQFPPSPSNCANCGGPASFPIPPAPSDTPSYIPIRFPAVNLPTPPTNTKEAIIRTPVPHSEKVEPLILPHQFTIPSKKITSQNDVALFHSSPSCRNFLGFVVSLSESINTRKLSDPCHVSPAVETLVSLIQKLTDYVDEIPPAQQAARYGNVSFRVWHERMSVDAKGFMLMLLPAQLNDAAVELVPYFTDSFGNASRIDYGTGHETNFVALLYCLARLGIVKEEDYQALVSRVFVKYMELMRKLQLTYSLEPAGSHGVWGLDDYHSLPYIFGSSQLIDHKFMKPKGIHSEDILENFSNEYMYLSCIVFIKKVKKGLFAEHSPMLDDISGVPNWSKVNSGLLKMYKIEVLQKVPIMQHFLFGSIIEWPSCYIPIYEGSFLLISSAATLCILYMIYLWKKCCRCIRRNAEDSKLYSTFNDPSTKGSKIVHGNYASGGSGTLDDTGAILGNVTSLNQHIRNIEKPSVRTGAAAEVEQHINLVH